jgi:hypothetical protein
MPDFGTEPASVTPSQAMASEHVCDITALMTVPTHATGIHAYKLSTTAGASEPQSDVITPLVTHPHTDGHALV